LELAVRHKLVGKAGGWRLNTEQGLKVRLLMP